MMSLGGLKLAEGVVAGWTWIGSHGLIVHMAEVRQLFYVFLLDGALERGGED